MREIKVRAWDKERKQFLTSPNWAEFQVNINGVLSAKNFPPPHLKGEQQLEIIQYIGLKDREGTEIYEGDILSQRYMEFMPQHFNEELKVNQGNIIGEVIYSRDCYRINDCSNETLHKITSTCVVIGNIYENKELLDEQKD